MSVAFPKNQFPILAVFVALTGLSFMVPQASADIIEVESATSCPGSLGGGLCNGSVPFLLSDLLTLLSAPNSIGAGTQRYIVTNNIGSSFSFALTSTGTGSGVAHNGSCQINGGATAFFNTCSITDSLNQTTSLGAGQINNLTFPATITFGGPAALGATFKLGFVSMEGSSSVVSAPEPASLTLLGSALLGLSALFRKRLTNAQR
jgi:hypothetical protein